MHLQRTMHGNGYRTDSKTSARMASVHSVDTGPELAVRKVTHNLGYRFRLHRRDLPGKPDLVFPGRRAVIFVHGCFWHRHCGCPRATQPEKNKELWQEKFQKNVERDHRALRTLRQLGWKTLVIWECQTSHERSLSNRLQKFLG